MGTSVPRVSEGLLGSHRLGRMGLAVHSFIPLVDLTKSLCYTERVLWRQRALAGASAQ
jgi:hypothetical protein